MQQLSWYIVENLGYDTVSWTFDTVKVEKVSLEHIHSVNFIVKDLLDI